MQGWVWHYKKGQVINTGYIPEKKINEELVLQKRIVSFCPSLFSWPILFCHP